MCIINLSLCASYLCISYMHPSRASSSLHQSVCKIGSASWQLHRVISTISIVYKTFRHCITPALQSYISRMHHSHGHRAYASRIILFNLIYSLSKNVLEQKLTLISFLSRFTTRSFPADFDGDCDLMFYPQTLAAKNEFLEPLVWKKNNWLVHTMAQ